MLPHAPGIGKGRGLRAPGAERGLRLVSPLLGVGKGSLCLCRWWLPAGSSVQERGSGKSWGD